MRKFFKAHLSQLKKISITLIKQDYQNQSHSVKPRSHTAPSHLIMIVKETHPCLVQNIKSIKSQWYLRKPGKIYSP